MGANRQCKCDGFVQATALGLMKPVMNGMSRKASVTSMALEMENVVQILVENGARPDARDSYGMTPLHYAALRGNATVTEQLIKFDAVNVDVIIHCLFLDTCR